MKRLLILGALLASLAAAAETKGYLLDKACADEDGKNPGFAAKHQKSCLQMKVCAQSGYGVMTDDLKYYTFDKNGNAMAAKVQLRSPSTASSSRTRSLNARPSRM